VFPGRTRPEFCHEVIDLPSGESGSDEVRPRAASRTVTAPSIRYVIAVVPDISPASIMASSLESFGYLVDLGTGQGTSGHGVPDERSVLGEGADGACFRL